MSGTFCNLCLQCLRRKLATTNPIESWLSTVQRVAQRTALARRRSAAFRRLCRRVLEQGVSQIRSHGMSTTLPVV